MIQTYSMIFLARPYKMSVDEMADISYQVLKELNDYGDELSPKYIPGRKKSEAREFDLSRENDRPTFVHWLNYYSASAAKKFKINRVLKSDQFECVAFSDGYYLKLQDNPINIDIHDHLELQRLVSFQLGLLK